MERPLQPFPTQKAKDLRRPIRNGPPILVVDPVGICPAGLRPLNPGVKGVSNNIIIKPRVNAVQVKEKIEQAIRRSAEVDAKRITVEVHEGRVILRGTVPSWAEREDAESAAWAAPGVSDVESHVKVEEEELVF